MTEYPPPCEPCGKGDRARCTQSPGQGCGCFLRACNEAEEEDRRMFPEDYA